MNFERRTKRWLSDYKANVLGVMEAGTFTYRGGIYPSSHILPISKTELNIIPSIRERFWRWFIDQEIALHRYFHHLNSSQALCFNLFFPLLVEGSRGLNSLLTSLGVPGAAGADGAFEFVPDPNENTHFDFMIALGPRARVYFEIKYTEAMFSSAIQDAEHLSKFERVYRPRLDGRLDERF